MRNAAGKPQGSPSWKRCRAGGEAFNYFTQMSLHADGTRLFAADTIAPLWSDATSPYQKQVLFNSNKPSGYDLRSYANYQAILRDQEGTTGVAIAPSDSSRWYTCTHAIICVIDVTNRAAMRGADGKGTANGFTVTMSPQTSYASFANTGGERNCGPYLKVHPTNKNWVLWGHSSGLTFSKDGFATDAGKLASVPAVTAGYWMVNVGWSPDGTKAYAHSFGNGLYVCSDTSATTPSFTLVSGSPLYISRMRVDQNGRVYMCTNTSSGVSSGDSNIWTYDAGTLTHLSGVSSDGMHDIAIDPTNVNRLVAISIGGASQRSYDRGATWSDRDVPAYGGISYVATDVPSLNLGVQTGNQPLSAIEFDPSQTSVIYKVAGEGVWYATYPASGGTVAWQSQNAGIYGLIPYSFVSHVGFQPVFGSQDRPVWTSTVSPDTSPPHYLVNGFSHCWGLAPSRANPGYTVANVNYSLTGNSSGWTDDNFATFHQFAVSPYTAGYGGGQMSVSANKDRIICNAGDNQPIRYTLDRGASAWSLLDLPGLASGCSGGQYSYYFIRQAVCPDPVDADEHMLWHPGIDGGGAPGNAANAGFFRVQLQSTGPTVTRLTTGLAAANLTGTYSSHLEGIPGRAGEFLWAADPNRYGAPLMRLKRTGATLTATAISAITSCSSFDFGPPPPGGAQASLWVLAIKGGVFGIHYTTDYPDDSATWVTFTAVPLDDFTGWPGHIRADRNIFGRIYAGVNGKAWVYADFLDPKAIA